MRKPIEIQCTHYTTEGKGAFRVGKKLYTLKNLIPGEKALVDLSQQNQPVLIKRINNAKERVEVPCDKFIQCGGCQLLHLSPQAQQTFKTTQVKNCFSAYRSLFVSPISECLMQTNPWYYRNKVQMPISADRKGQILIGLYEEGSLKIIEKDDCLIQNKMATKVLQVIRSLIKRHRVSGFNWQTHKGQLKYLLLRYGFTTGELMLVIVTNGPSFPYYREWTRELTKQVPELVTIVQNINLRKDHLVLDRQQKIWYGKGYIADYIGDVKFLISPNSFYQINPPQVKRLYDCVRQFAQLSGQEIVVDAYCGVGTISLYLAKNAKKVYGVEVVAPAIQDAIKNAKLNSISNVSFQVGDASEYLVYLAKRKMHVDVVVVDPPRSGCTPELLHAVLKLSPKRFIYVSCNIETQARDLAFFQKSDYKVTANQSFDLFPQTYHIENVLLLEKQLRKCQS